MPKVDFYLLNETGAQSRWLFTCRLVEKAYRLGHQIYLHTASKEDAQTLDDLLWTYRDDNFLPHNLYTANAAENQPPIQIGYAISPTQHQDILVNLAHEIPGFFQQFQRIIEIIPADANLRDIGRNNYRLYRDQGYQLESHQLKN